MSQQPIFNEKKIIRRYTNENYYDESRLRCLYKEEKKQQNTVLQIQNKIMDIDMHNIEGKVKVQSYAWLSC